MFTLLFVWLQRNVIKKIYIFYFQEKNGDCSGNLVGAPKRIKFGPGSRVKLQIHLYIYIYFFGLIYMQYRGIHNANALRDLSQPRSRVFRSRNELNETSPCRTPLTFHIPSCVYSYGWITSSVPIAWSRVIVTSSRRYFFTYADTCQWLPHRRWACLNHFIIRFFHNLFHDESKHSFCR